LAGIPRPKGQNWEKLLIPANPASLLFTKDNSPAVNPRIKLTGRAA
jgi:hypothetical protein